MCLIVLSFRLLHFPLSAHHLLSLNTLSLFLPVNFIFQDVVEKFPVHFRQMRTLAPLPSTTSHNVYNPSGEKDK